MNSQGNCGIRSLSLLLGICVWSGCDGDDRPSGVPVTGVVYYNGAPVEGADVAFSQGDIPGHGAFARTNSEGWFEMSSLKNSIGIPPGSYRVKITKMSVQSDWHPEHDEGVRPKETVTVVLPRKYGGFSSSGLTADVVPGNDNEFRFDLGE